MNLLNLLQYLSRVFHKHIWLRLRDPENVLEYSQSILDYSQNVPEYSQNILNPQTIPLLQYVKERGGGGCCAQSG